MKKGYVVAVNHEDHSVDVLLSDGRRMTGVQVLAGVGASAKTGSFNLPTVPPSDGKDKWDVSQKNGKDQIAVIDFVEDIPVVVGFLYPQISEMTFADKDLYFFRHQSDATISIEKDGSIQVAHPGGTYLKIGSDPEPKDHAGTNIDENLELTENLGVATTVRIGVAGANGGDHVVRLTMSPDGKVELLAEDNITVIGQKNINVEAKEKVDVKAYKGVSVTAYAGGVNVTAYSGGVNVDAYLGGVTVKSYQGGVGIVAYTGNIDVAATQGWVNILGSVGVNVESAGNILLTAGNLIKLTAPRIDLN